MTGVAPPDQPKKSDASLAVQALHVAAVALVLLVCGLVLSRNHADPDFWGHVRYGRDVLMDGLPLTATYTYTAIAYPWINHENLSEIVFAWVVDHMGPAALLWFKTLAGIGLMGLLWHRMVRQGIRAFVAVGMLLLTSLNLMFFWSLRPQIFSYLSFAALILLLERAFRAWRATPAHLPPAAPDWRPLMWGLPPLFVLWGNAHGGFVLGLVFLSGFLVLRIVEAAWRRGPVRKWSLQFPVVVLLACAATFINPYGVDLHRWLLYSLGSPRPEIVEWRPPELLSIVWWQWWTLVVVAVASLGLTPARRDPVHVVLLVLVLWQSLAHQRHIPFFALCFALWGPVYVDAIWTQLRGELRDDPLGAGWPGHRRWITAGGLAVASAAMVWLIGEQNKRIPVPRDGYPVDAFQYMAEQRLHGRLVSQFKWAQYALAAFGGTDGRRHMQLAFDGRFRTCYPQRVVDMYFDFAVGKADGRHRFRDPASPPPDPAWILRDGHPDLVLIDRAQTVAAATMRAHADQWVLLYQDGLAELWGRRETYDDPRKSTYVPESARRITDRIPTGMVDWPAVPTLVSSTPQLAGLTRQ